MADSPFSLSPNPTALHITPPLRSTLHKVRYTIDHRQGLAAVLGDVGVGKSTVLRYLYAEYSAHSGTLAMFCPTAQFPSPFAMARHVATGIGAPTARSLTTQREYLERRLMELFAAGENVVLFLDEAQMLTAECLELVRTMLNFETSEEKLIQIVLGGQLDLRDRLRQKRHKPLRSRVFAPCIISPLSYEETVAVLESRCARAGIQMPFAADALTEIYEHSGGIPRAALRIAEMAYGIATSAGISPIDGKLIATVLESEDAESLAATA